MWVERGGRRWEGQSVKREMGEKLEAFEDEFEDRGGLLVHREEDHYCTELSVLFLCANIAQG